MTYRTIRATLERLALLRAYFDACALDLVPTWHPQPCRPRARAKSSARQRGARRGWERREEAYDAVRFDLGDDCAALSVFESHKHALYGAWLARKHARTTLTEVVQEYLQEHSSEVALALSHFADAADEYGREPVPTDEELDLESLARSLERWAA